MSSLSLPTPGATGPLSVGKFSPSVSRDWYRRYVRVSGYNGLGDKNKKSSLSSLGIKLRLEAKIHEVIFSLILSIFIGLVSQSLGPGSITLVWGPVVQIQGHFFVPVSPFLCGFWCVEYPEFAPGVRQIKNEGAVG